MFSTGQELAQFEDSNYKYSAEAQPTQTHIPWEASMPPYQDPLTSQDAASSTEKWKSGAPAAEVEQPLGGAEVEITDCSTELLKKNIAKWKIWFWENLFQHPLPSAYLEDAPGIEVSDCNSTTHAHPF